MFRKTAIVVAVIAAFATSAANGSMTTCSTGSNVGNGALNIDAYGFLNQSFQTATNATMRLDFTVEHRANQGFVVSLNNGHSTYTFAYGTFTSSLPSRTDDITSWLNGVESVSTSVLPEPFSNLNTTFGNMCFTSSTLGVTDYKIDPVTMNSGEALAWAFTEFKNYGDGVNSLSASLKSHDFVLHGTLSAPLSTPTVPEPGTMLLITIAGFMGLRRSETCSN